MKTKTSIASCLMAAATLQAQTFEWVKTFGSSREDQGNSIALDASGNVYVTGDFHGTVDLDPGAGTDIHTAATGAYGFIQKLDASGNFLWAKSFGGTGGVYVESLALDASGNVYTTGYFKRTADFDPDTGTNIHTSVGYQDVFIQKLDASGNFLWAKSFGGSSNDWGYSIALDASGNVITSGIFHGTIDFDPGNGTANLTSTSAAYYDIFIQKLDASGNFLWAKSIGNSSWNVGFSITLDASGNVYVTGSFSGTIDLDPGAGTDIHTSASTGNNFILKLDASGNFLWAKSFGGTGGNTIESIVLDASGNIYLTGSFSGTIDLDPGAGTDIHTSAGYDDVFIQKLDASGSFLWAKSFGGNAYDIGYSIALDASENVYITGGFTGTVDSYPGAGTAMLSSAGLYDVFIQKLDASGNFLWAKSFGGSSNDWGYSIALDPSGNVYATGVFEGTGDFDPGAGTAYHTSAGREDVFVLKMNPSAVGVWENALGHQTKIFPNPTTGTFIIDLGDAYEATFITISDALGRTVSTSKHQSTSTIHLSLDQPAGIYFIEIESDDHSAKLKLIKE